MTTQTTTHPSLLADAMLQGRSARREAALGLVRAKLSAEPSPRGFFARRRHRAFLKAEARILRSSLVWSDALYAEMYPDVAARGVSPIRHYLNGGWRELRDPHPAFNSGWYLAHNPDVFAAGLNPFIHYLKHGAAEGRAPNAAFDGAWYLERYPDVAASGFDPFVHYLLHGAAEGRWPHPLFDAAWYAKSHGVVLNHPWSALAHYVRQGLTEDAAPNEFFESRWYRRANLDVATTDADPLAHYLNLGWKVGRLPAPTFTGEAFAKTVAAAAQSGVPPLVQHLHDPVLPDIDVLYVGNDPDNLSHSYRVRHPVEVLMAAGIAAMWLAEADLSRNMKLLTAAKCVVFARVAWGAITGEAVERCRKAGVPVLFDIDDHVFDAGVANARHVDGLRFISAEDRIQYDVGVGLYRRMLMECDATLATTSSLVDAAKRLGKPAFQLANGTRGSVLATSREALSLKRRKAGTEPVVIGYASGTKTHQRDFSLVAGSLAQLMAERPEVRLSIVGQLDLTEFPDLKRFGSRITSRPVVPVDELPFEYARFDINLAPLEIGNPFCEAKSPLKYLEAGLVAVPTVASATGPFKSAIRDGETGFLAVTEGDWLDALRKLAGDEDLRTRVGQQALRHCAEELPGQHRLSVLSVFSPFLSLERNVAATALSSAVRRASSSRSDAEERSGEGLKIGWIVPGLLIGGGGHRNILRAAHFLHSFGHDVALYFTMDDGRSADEFRDLVRKHFYPFAGDVFVYGGEGRQEDVLFATHWTTVAPALTMTPRAGEIMYFVQDFEPSFSPMSSEYVLAENTYRKGLYAITSGRWCERLLRKEFGAEADHFQFPIDRDIYHVRPAIPRGKRVVFFAKPEMPRRCFELGLEALRLLNRIDPEVEIVFFGSSQARNHVGFPARFMDVLPTISDLAELYAGASLGIVFSTTNPSLVPYEMMACGLPVVDLGRVGNEVNYDDRLDLAFLANPEPAVMARQIATLLQDGEELAMRSRNGVAFVQGFPTELEMARRVESLILARMQSRLGHAPSERATAGSRGAQAG